MEIKNAVIEDTFLGRECHGIFTFSISVMFDGCVCCNVGGYALDGYDKQTQRRVFHAKSAELISRILDVVGVDRWENLKGKYVRIKDCGFGSPVYEIGNLMEDKWLNVREFFQKSDD